MSIARERPYQAQADFETALTYFPDHPAAIVGISSILMDIYSEKLLPPPVVHGLEMVAAAKEGGTYPPAIASKSKLDKHAELPQQPLGLVPTKAAKMLSPQPFSHESQKTHYRDLPPPHKATSLPLLDRLAARDRAYMLLSGLTKLGSGWNDSEAWFALARAYEESDQTEKAKDALWWCVELEDARGARQWRCVGVGGYVL